MLLNYVVIRKMVRRTCKHRVIKVLVVFLIVGVVFQFILNDFMEKIKLRGMISDSSYVKATVEIEKYANLVFVPSKCDTVYIGMAVLNSNAILDFYTVFKSILYFRSNPLHLHILVDNKTEYILKNLFETWSIFQLNVSYYTNHNLNLINFNKEIISTLHKLLSNSGIEKILIVESDKIFTDNINNFWIMFENLKKTQFLGIIDIEYDSIPHKTTKSNKIILLRLKNFPSKNLKLLKMLPAAAYHPNFYYTLSCHIEADENVNCYDSKRNMSFQWTTAFYKRQHLNHTFFLRYDGSLLREKVGNCGKNEKIFESQKKKVNSNCSEFLGNTISPNWRTLLFFQDSKFSLVENDVTLVSQLSYDRINLLEELQRLWNGPISLSLYAADSEVNDILDYIKNYKLMQNRIVFHIIFKEDNNYPINVLRNVALKNVVTPYVFLVDIDFIPSHNLYSHLRNHLSNAKITNKQAFIVPAFETKKHTIPKTKFELLGLLNQKTIFPFHYTTYPAAHKPTNYLKWIFATEPYKVQWKLEYEPYLVVQKNVTSYDTRFSGYGWNKVSHIMELYKQQYEFHVLPNVFIVHKNHKLSKEKKKLVLSVDYQRCLKEIKKDFIRDINRKYKKIYQ